MSFSKQQTIGAVGAGVFVVLAGALGWMLWDAFSARSEAEEELASQIDAFTRYNKAAVFPSLKSIADVKTNEASYIAWHESAMDVAARGDKVLPPETPPIFKQRLQGEVRRMALLPGGAEGRIAVQGFLFGFEQYLGEGGVLPAAEDVPVLAVQLDFIVNAVDLFKSSGVQEVKSVKRLGVPVVAPSADEDSGHKAKKKQKGKKGDSADQAPKGTCQRYEIEFLARPAAFVSVLNGFAVMTRFVVVENLSFKQSEDSILNRILAVEKVEAEKAAPSSQTASPRRRRRAAVMQEAPPSEAADSSAAGDSIVSDPELDAPLLVSMTLDVWDFGRGASAQPSVSADAPTANGAEGSVAAKKEVK